jgi:hypothetical protein
MSLRKTSNWKPDEDNAPLISRVRWDNPIATVLILKSLRTDPPCLSFISWKYEALAQPQLQLILMAQPYTQCPYQMKPIVLQQWKKTTGICSHQYQHLLRSLPFQLYCICINDSGRPR